MTFKSYFNPLLWTFQKHTAFPSFQGCLMYERLIIRGWKSGLTSERKNFWDWSLGAAASVCVKTFFYFPSQKLSWIFKITCRGLSLSFLVDGGEESSLKMLTSVNLGSMCTLQFLWRFYQKPIVKKTSHFNSRNLRKSRFRKHPLAGLSDGSGANSVCRGKSKGSSVCAGACVQSWSQIQHETLAPK